MTEATNTSTKTVKIPVTRKDNGEVVEFNAKQKLVKNSTINEDTGHVSVELIFNTGDVRTYTVNPALLLRFAAHGAEQKLGDAIAGETDMADGVLAIDDLIKRLDAGEWNVRREAGAFAGTSILIRALVEASGKDVEEIKTFLANKTQAEKVALRKTDKLRPIIDRLESEKAKNSKSSVDTDALLGELGLDATPALKAGKSKSSEG